MPRKPPKNLIIEHDGTLYVQVRAVMNPLCALADGLSVAFFSQAKNAPMYMTVEAAIKWCEAEKKYHSRERYEKIIENLERIRAEVS